MSKSAIEIKQRDNPKDYKKHHKGKLDEYERMIESNQTDLERAKDEIARLGQKSPTKEQFIELTQSYLETVLNTDDLIEEDLVYKEVVLNLHAGDDAVSVIKLNPPYDIMVDLEKISTGGEQANSFEPLRRFVNWFFDSYDETVVERIKARPAKPLPAPYKY